MSNTRDDSPAHSAETWIRRYTQRTSGTLAFRHELARRAVVATLPAMRRRALHAPVVAALRELGATCTEQIVHHAVAAGDADTVLEFAPAAARAAADGGSHRQALAHLEAAAVHADRLPPESRARLLDDLGWQLTSRSGSPRRSRSGGGRWRCASGWTGPSWRLGCRSGSRATCS